MDKLDKQEILDKYELCKNAYTEQYEDCMDDWEFLQGDSQWDAAVEKRRKRSNQPCLVLNQLLPYANQVVNDNRQSNIAISISPADGDADVDTAEIFQGLIRNIERQSNAENVYATAVMNAVGAGIGWIRVSVDYAGAMSFDQEITIERVLDFTSVMLDPASEELDGSDAEYGIIIRTMSEGEFEAKYPDADVVSFDEVGLGEDEVSIAEYYGRYYEDETIYLIELIDGSQQVIAQDKMDKLEELQGTPTEVQFAIIDERVTQIPYIKHCVYSGADEPIEESDFPCDYIPLIPVIGNEVFIDGKRTFKSLINPAKDAQRIYNYLESANVEYMALQPKSPWVGAIGSFASRADIWADANTENYPYLEYDIVYDDNDQRVEPPTRSQPIQGSMALMQSAQVAKDNIRYSIGIPPANMGEQGNEVSGVAVRNRQLEGDNATYHFTANLASSISHLGRILVNMIPRVYNRPMVRRILGDDGEERNIPINQPFIKQQGGDLTPAKGQPTYDGIYELGAGKYDVVCDIGASYSSKRQEMSDKLSQLIAARPELMDVTGDLVFEAMDLPNSKEIATRLKTIMNPQFFGEDPTAEKLKQASAQIQELQKSIEMYDAALNAKKKNTEFDKNMKLRDMMLKSEKLKIEAKKTQSDIEKTAAEIEKMRAETTGFNIDAVTSLGNAVSGIAAQVDDMGQAMNIMLEAKEAEYADMDDGMMGQGGEVVAPNETEVLEGNDIS